MQFEDQPGWDCSTMGNLICGLPDTAVRTSQDLGLTPFMAGVGIGFAIGLIACAILIAVLITEE